MQTDRRVGTQFGDYLIVDVLGRGGMGIVYRATRPNIGESVALKLMAPELSDSEEFRERFIREGQLGPMLDHPNVVPIFEAGEIDGELFIAMKLIEGRDLKTIIKEDGPLEPKRVLRIFRQIAAALDAAHEAGVVHRDIKPQNILISRDEGGHELVYVSDFGLVKPTSSETSSSRTGQVFGSIQYMAPELIESEPTDGRADVYSMGCVLYECLAGKEPFERHNEVAVIWAHVHEDPPRVTDSRPQLAAGVDDVVIKAMFKHPDDRFLTCGELVAELEVSLGRKASKLRFALVRPLIARVPRPKTEREVWSPNFFPELARIRSASRSFNWYKVAAFVTVLTMLASLQVGRDGGLPQVATDLAEGAGSASRSLIRAVSRDEPSTRDLDGRDSGSGSGFVTAEQGGRTSGAITLGTLDDARRKALADQSGLSAPIGTAAATGLSEIVFVEQVSDQQEIFTIRPNGTGFERLTWNPAIDSTPSLSPDGRKVVFMSTRDGRQDLYILNLDRRRTRRLTDDLYNDSYPQWSPDGDRIVYETNEDDPVTECEAQSCVPGENYIFVINVDGTHARSPADQGQNHGPSWSPDGKKIVFQSGSDLWVMKTDGTGRTRLTATSGTERSPRWAPDGKKILFMRDGDLYVLKASGRVTRLTNTPVITESGATWSPDGSRIAYEKSEPGGNRDIWIMQADGTGSFNLTRDAADSFAPDWR